MWLSIGDEGTREQHQEMKKWCCSRAAGRDRQVQRQNLHDDPEAQDLFEDRELQKYDDEESELEVIPH